MLRRTVRAALFVLTWASAQARAEPLEFGPEIQVGRQRLECDFDRLAIASSAGRTLLAGRAGSRNGSSAGLWVILLNQERDEIDRALVADGEIAGLPQLAWSEDRAVLAYRAENSTGWSLATVSVESERLTIEPAEAGFELGELRVAGAPGGWLLVHTDTTNTPSQVDVSWLGQDGAIGIHRRLTSGARSIATAAWTGEGLVVGWIEERDAELAWLENQPLVPVLQSSSWATHGESSVIAANGVDGTFLFLWEADESVLARRYAEDGTLSRSFVVYPFDTGSLDAVSGPGGWLVSGTHLGVWTKLVPVEGDPIDGPTWTPRNTWTAMTSDAEAFTVALSGRPPELHRVDAAAHEIDSVRLPVVLDVWTDTTAGIALSWSGSSFLLVGTDAGDGTFLAHWLAPSPPSRRQQSSRGGAAGAEPAPLADHRSGR